MIIGPTIDGRFVAVCQDCGEGIECPTRAQAEQVVFCRRCDRLRDKEALAYLSASMRDSLLSSASGRTTPISGTYADSAATRRRPSSSSPSGSRASTPTPAPKSARSSPHGSSATRQPRLRTSCSGASTEIVSPTRAIWTATTAPPSHPSTARTNSHRGERHDPATTP